MKFDMKAPCANCPFRREGAIDLREGRLEGIIQALKDDHNTFHCHKTVHSRLGGEWDDEGNYRASGKESACMGALAYMLRWHGQVSLLTRMAIAGGKLSMRDIRDCVPLVKEQICK